MPVPADLTVDLGAASVRRIQRFVLSTVGAPTRPGEPAPDGSSNPLSGTRWVRFQAPSDDRTGVVRVALSARDAVYGSGADPTLAFGWTLYRDIDGTFGGLVRLTGEGVQRNMGVPSARLNCEGYAQGRDESAVEWAWGYGDGLCLQVATYGESGGTAVALASPFAVEVVVDPIADPVDITSAPVDPACTGPVLTSLGAEDRFFLAWNGWPARLAAGSGAFDCQMFACDEWVETGAGVHYRAFTVAWDAVNGVRPWAFLSPHKRFFTTQGGEDHEVAAMGTGTPDGQNHVPVHHIGHPDVLWSTVGAGMAGSDTWGAAWWAGVLSGHPAATIGGIVWGGAGLPDRVLVQYDEGGGSGRTMLAELDLAGAVVTSHVAWDPSSGIPFEAAPLWPTPDGTHALAVSNDSPLHLPTTTTLHRFRLSDDTWETTAPMAANFRASQIVGVQPGGDVVVKGFDDSTHVASIGIVVAAGTSIRAIRAGSSGTSSSGGLSPDGLYAYLPSLGRDISDPARHLYTRMDRMEVESGTITHLFDVRHPFHDTIDWPDRDTNPGGWSIGFVPMRAS